MFLGSGDFQRERKDKEVQQAREKWGRGETWMGKTEGNYCHKIYLIVPKGINKNSENLAHAWCFANKVTGFLGFKMIYLHILGPKYRN